jgi:sortase A
MQNLHQKHKRTLTSRFLLVLVSVAFLQFTFESRSAIAETGKIAVERTELTQIIDLDSYKPDQSLWSEKMKLKYKKAQITEEAPIALLKIERLNLEAPIYYGTDRKTLNRGLGSVEGSTPPGETGNIALSGHRDSFFRVLKDIKHGDAIEMRTLAGIEHFEVSEITIVDALDISLLDPTDTTVLTLITCHPFYYEGYAPDRYIVRATPVGEYGHQNSIEGGGIQASSGIH